MALLFMLHSNYGRSTIVGSEYMCKHKIFVNVRSKWKQVANETKFWCIITSVHELPLMALEGFI